jgi:ribosomal protein S10
LKEKRTNVIVENLCELYDGEQKYSYQLYNPKTYKKMFELYNLNESILEMLDFYPCSAQVIHTLNIKHKLKDIS